MNDRWLNRHVAAVIATLALAGATPAQAAVSKAAPRVSYGESIGTYQLARLKTIELGKQSSVRAAVRAAKRVKVPTGGYAMADVMDARLGRIAIDAKGVVHPVMRTAGSGPRQSPPSAPEVQQQ